MKKINLKGFLHRNVFSVGYSLSRSKSGMWWCCKREKWVSIEDNLGTLSNSTHNVSRRKIKKYIKEIPLSEKIWMLKTIWIFGKRKMVEFTYDGDGVVEEGA